MEQKRSRIGRLTKQEKEKQILDLYFDKRLTYGQIAHELRMSPRDVTPIIKRAKGEPVTPKEAQQLPTAPAENFKEIYSRFQKGESPLQVAQSLNLRVEYVNELYLGYLNSIRLFAVTQLFREECYEGLEIVRAIAAIFKGYKIKPKDYGRAVRYMQNYYDESTNLEELRRLRDGVNASIYRGREEIAQIEAQKSKSQKELTNLEKQVAEEKTELSEIRKEAERLEQIDPRIPVVQLAEAKVKEFLQDRWQLVVAAVDASLSAIQQDPNKRLLMDPTPWNVQEEIARIPGGIEKLYALYKGAVVDVAYQLFERLVKQIGNEASSAINGSNAGLTGDQI